MTGYHQHCAPSTFDADLPDGRDPVFTVLKNAYDRYADNGIYGNYTDQAHGQVCAGGALMAAQADDEGVRWYSTAIAFIEQHATDATKEAIELLKQAAAELYPWSVDPTNWGYGGNEGNTTWPFGALESLNEDSSPEWKQAVEAQREEFEAGNREYNDPDDPPLDDEEPFYVRKQRVLMVYEHAMAKRFAETHGRA